MEPATALRGPRVARLVGSPLERGVRQQCSHVCGALAHLEPLPSHASAQTLPDHKRRRYSAGAPAFRPGPVARLARSRGGTPPLLPPTFPVFAPRIIEAQVSRQGDGPVLFNLAREGEQCGPGADFDRPAPRKPRLCTRQSRILAGCRPGQAPVFGGSAASWLFKFTAKPHFLLGACTACVLLPNVRAEATPTVWRLGRGTDDMPWRFRGPGATPLEVASRARG
jgi:hypothetical protein